MSQGGLGSAVRHSPRPHQAHNLPDSVILRAYVPLLPPALCVCALVCVHGGSAKMLVTGKFWAVLPLITNSLSVSA